MKKNRIIPILCAVILSAVVLTSVIAAASLPNRQNGNGGDFKKKGMPKFKSFGYKRGF